MSLAPATLSTHASTFQRARASFRDLFAADTRSLALTRVCVAALVLVDLAWRARDIRAFYSDAGLLPRVAWEHAYRHGWSLHALSGRPSVLAVLFAAHGAFAFAMLVGWQTRVATLLTWLLMASLHGRNPAVLQGGDTLLLLLLFWGIFAPWGARISVDALRRRAIAPTRVLSVGTLGLVLQMPLVYLVTAMQKHGPEWRTNFRAVYYALNDDLVTSSVGKLVGRAPLGLLEAMTVATLVVELALPILLFCPWKTTHARTLALAVATTLQSGFAVCFRIGLFPFVSTVALGVFVPEAAWTWLEGRAPYRRLRAALEAHIPPARRVRRVSALRDWVIEGACAAALLLALYSNASSVRGARMPRPVARAAAALRLEQGWKMFVRPQKKAGWYVAVGRTRAGGDVDLLRGGATRVRWDRPAHASDVFANYRWRKYFGNVRLKKMARHRPSFGRWLCRDWNGGHRADDRLETVGLYWLTAPGGSEHGAAPRKQLVLERTCVGKEAKRKHHSGGAARL